MGLKLEHVSYLYGTDTELLVRALDDVNLEIPDGAGWRDRPYRFRKIDAGAASERAFKAVRGNDSF